MSGTFSNPTTLHGGYYQREDHFGFEDDNNDDNYHANTAITVNSDHLGGGNFLFKYVYRCILFISLLSVFILLGVKSNLVDLKSTWIRIEMIQNSLDSPLLSPTSSPVLGSVRGGLGIPTTVSVQSPTVGSMPSISASQTPVFIPTSLNPPPVTALPTPIPAPTRMPTTPTSSPSSFGPTPSISGTPITSMPSLSPTYEPGAPTPFPTNGTEAPTGGGMNNLEIAFKRDGYSKVELHGDLLYYEFLKDYEAVIEPYAVMVPVITDLTSDERFYAFKICMETSKDSGIFTDCVTGNMTLDYIPAFAFECDPFDKLFVKLDEYQTSNDALLRSAEGYAICMYVRREVRDLTEADLSATMDAMYEMWLHTEEEGQELYGDNFHSADYFVGFHYFNAAWQDADHIHEGNGFLPQHIKITNMFEESMQAVNPAVTIFFWDFTIESAYGQSIYNSSIMTPDIFGTMTLPQDPNFGFTYANDSILSGAVPDGRWAYTPVNINTKFTDMLSGYGYLRAPWNQNPSPYLSRFVSYMDITLPDCGSHYTALQQTDLTTFTQTIEAGPHAKTHVKLGGVFGCDLLYTMYEKGLIKSLQNFQDMCGNWAFSLKEFWRDNFLIPNTGCSIDEDSINDSSCGFECNDPDDLFITDIMTKFAASVPENMTRQDWETWKEFICDGDGQRIVFGEHLESSSTSDPSFWPIHPTLERLLQAKMMSGGFETDSWATDPINSYVCDKSTCYSPSYDAFDTFEDCCLGHYESSKMFDAVSANRSNYFGLTNGEVLAKTDPTKSSYSMTYIYSDFEWPHCYETDHLTNFDALLLSLAAEYTKSPTSSPTSFPSISFQPTAPTLQPSAKPSGTPTYKPTPTRTPTIPYPTQPPTTTQHPTHGVPTEPPTITPPPTTTWAPTPGRPTQNPTVSGDTPVGSPTAAPVLTKTLAPTFENLLAGAPTLAPLTVVSMPSTLDVPTSLEDPTASAPVLAPYSDPPVEFTDPPLEITDPPISMPSGSSPVVLAPPVSGGLPTGAGGTLSGVLGADFSSPSLSILTPPSLSVQSSSSNDNSRELAARSSVRLDAVASTQGSTTSKSKGKIKENVEG